MCISYDTDSAFQAHTLRNSRIPAAGEMYESICSFIVHTSKPRAHRRKTDWHVHIYVTAQSEKERRNIYMLHHKFNVDRKAIQRMQFTQDSKTCKTKQYIVWKYKYIWGKTFKESKGKINTKPRITVIIISDGQRKGGNWGWFHRVLLGFGQGLLLTVGSRQDK